MRLSDIVNHIPGVISVTGDDLEIAGVECDSRKVSPGCLFVAVRGEKVDGHAFVKSAVAAGASAVLVEDPTVDVGEATKVVVADCEEALGWAASAFYGNPSRHMTLIGLTGTNGKTTTSYLIQHVLKSFGIKTGKIGTISYDFVGGEVAAPLTTPDAPTFQKILRTMQDQGAEAAVAEISSHALKRKRVVGSSFSCAVFTNLTQDHLDFHGTMEEYYEAKKLLFTDYPRIVEAVVNIDDEWGRELAPDLGGHVVTYGLNAGDIRFEVQKLKAGKTLGILHYPGGQLKVETPLSGLFNAYNATSALATAWALGLDLRQAVEAMKTAPKTPGRIEPVENALGINAFVDYAHTPDALLRVMEAVRPLTEGRLICLFGCGGDRDKGKRPQMAAVVAKMCDVAVVTADNSRSENTLDIMADIEKGFVEGWEKLGKASSKEREFYAMIPDRREAIEYAVAIARPGDSIVLAGKGHETTQTIGGVVTHFDDREELKNALLAREQKCA